MPRPDDREDLGPTVMLFRRLRGLSRKQLADAAGMDKSQLARYESGKETPSQRTLERLATAAGVPVHLIEPITSFVRQLREALAGSTAPALSVSAGSTGLEPEIQRVVEQAASQARAELKLWNSRRPVPAEEPG